MGDYFGYEVKGRTHGAERYVFSNRSKARGLG